MALALAIPGAYITLAIRAALLGHSLHDLAFIYVNQVGSNNDQLTFNAPTVYQLLRPVTGEEDISTVGVVFAAALALLLVLLAVRSGRTLTAERIIVLALMSVLVTVFFLPGMHEHERYFYLADVVSLIAMFLVPRLWPVPLLVQFASGLAYVPFLFSRQGQDAVSIDQRVLAIAVIVAMILTAREFVRQFDLATVLRAARTDTAEPCGPVAISADANGYRKHPGWPRPNLLGHSVK